MKHWNQIFLCCMVFCFLAACASKKTVIVLLPDPDGEVGVVEVKNKKGSQILDKAGYAVHVEKAEQAPRAPEPMAKEKIEKLFGDAMAAQPEQPGQFLLLFHSGSTRLTDESWKKLQTIPAIIKKRDSKHVSISGHSDSVGSEHRNLKLASERAKFITDFLLSKGVDPEDLEITSHGETRPMIKTGDEVDEPLNRRVIVIIK
ncbi:MAG: OmpA family protein [Desulfobacterales bacterium]|nr:OmpA family protein [Desulfobacterales bacterium]